MKILYFGSYNPNYSRNRVIIDGLSQNGVTVSECNVEGKSFTRFFKLLFKYLGMDHDYDFMIVGFPGQEVMFLAKLLSSRPIIFDAFTSHYEGYILDRKYFSKNSLRARYYRFLDEWSCKLADMVLLDTDAHVNFFVREFGLRQGLFRKIYVGTDPKRFFPLEPSNIKDKFTIHFHGNYIPLQGPEYIVGAAKILENENIQFNLLGRGQTYQKCYDLAREFNLKNINFVDKVPYEDLNKHINSADLSLGIFGDTPKTDVVIPNKIFESLAAGKAIITSETNAAKELLTDRKNVIFCRSADPKNLADKIMELKNNRDLLAQIGTGGLEIFRSEATPTILGKQLIDYIYAKF